ncbi:MAG: DUF3987 domain-containing protein [Ferruginibacter sp.]|nr:DUF3987 domain-containing protein [Ferruginibacter sp.]
MAKKEFIPSDWLEKPKQIQTEPVQFQPNVLPGNEQIEQVIQEIEARNIDIASAYADWRDIGFAFADAFGESGRDYFHRISCFYPDYTVADCNSQYDNCLKASGTGITLATFFYHAKQAGIKLLPKASKEDIPPEVLPTLGQQVYDALPDFLKSVISIATTEEEKDILILGSIVCLSACLHKLYGIYDGKKVYSNLYLFITAQASAGKGRLVHCKQLVKPVHRHLREQATLLKQQYELEMLDYNQNKGKDSNVQKPNKPPEKMLFIPANNSTTGVYQLLSDNESRGLMFETEGDTLAQAFKTDYGNFSEGFRKAYHHETISYYRRTDREYADIEAPCLSTVLSGTPKQIATLIPNAENGLFSRFIFYFMNVQVSWKNVFRFDSDNGLDDYFDGLGSKFFSLYQMLASGTELQFSLTAPQQQQFNSLFEQLHSTQIALQGLDYMATVRRLGLIAFRLCMILSALRIMEHGEIPPSLICEDRDFQTVMAMVKVLVRHSGKVFTELPEDAPKPKRKNQKERFYEALPTAFNRQEYLKIALSMNIPDKTAEGYITDCCKKSLLHRDKKDYYLKPEP